MAKTKKISSAPEEALLTRKKRKLAKATHFPVAIKLDNINSRSKADTKNTKPLSYL